MDYEKLAEAVLFVAPAHLTKTWSTAYTKKHYAEAVAAVAAVLKDELEHRQSEGYDQGFDDGFAQGRDAAYGA